MSRTLQLAVNPHIVDKAIEGQVHTLTTKFENVSITIEELANYVNQGHPFCPQHSGGRRSNANFVRSDVLGVDIDAGLTLVEALANPYIQQHAAMIYTTPNHTDARNKFRIVFALERAISDGEEMRAALRGVIRKFGGDIRCDDSCRLFFGSKNSKPIILGNVLSNEALAELTALGSEARISDRICGDTNKSGDVATTRSSIALEKHQQVTPAGGMATSLDTLSSGTMIHCPIHHDHRPSAYVVTNRYGINGVHCRTCRSSFWPRSESSKPSLRYDFHAMENIIREQNHDQTPANFYDDEDFAAHPDLRSNTERTSFLFSEQYLPDLPFGNGVTLVRSPKGSGKSEWLASVVKECKERSMSVLLIGHRQTLIQGIAKRLGLTCYFYTEGSVIKNNPPEDYYAICVDSIGKLLNTDVYQYDVVIIDESEQVFSHLTSDTLKKKRRSCYIKMFHYLCAAKSVIVADADLGPITIEALYQAIGGDAEYKFHMNEYKESRCDFHYYDSDTHLTAKMIETIRAGGRHYVSTNSKNRAEIIHSMIEHEFGETRKLMLVTSDTTGDANVLSFINNIKTEILKYDVVIASPTLGTGIDITFPREAKHIDTVFGFFMPRVNTHFDIDQQLSRVRHPKALMVWVAPERFGFEIDPCVIRSEVLDNSVLNDVLIQSRPGKPPILDDTYLSVYAHVTSVQRASKNNLRKNLLDLRKRNGWSVQTVAMLPEFAKDGKNRTAQAKSVIDTKRVKQICDALPMSREDYNYQAQRSSSGVKLSKSDEMSMRRYELEKFYHADISPGLIVNDEKGKFRDQVRMMETYLTPIKQLTERAATERDFGYFASDIGHGPIKNLLLRQLLSAAGLADATTHIKTEVIFTKYTLGSFISACQQNRAKIQELFGITVRSDVKANAVQQLGKVLDLIGLQTTKPERQKVGVVTTYYYQIDAGSWDAIRDVINRRAAGVVRSVSDIELLAVADIH